MQTAAMGRQAFFLSCLLALGACVNLGNSSEDVKVVIIGAGASGYAAGCRLLENNFTEFVILEAQDRIGGRIHSVQYGRDKIDMGAQWIHGEVGNIVNEMATKYDLVYKSSGIPFNPTVYQSDGKKFGPGIFNLVTSFLERVSAEDKSHVTGSDGEYNTKRFWEIMEPVIANNTVTRDEAAGLLRLAESMENSLEASPSWLTLSPHSFYEDHEGEFNVVWKSGGYSTLFELLSKRIPDPNKQLKIDERIRLRKEVTKVEWSGDRAIVRCADGSEFTADRVLTTVSLNVLKATADKIFSPPLPQQNLNAITGLGMGTVDKIYLSFPYRWWAPGNGGIALSWRQEDIDALPEELKWTTGIFDFTSLDNFPLDILCGWITGVHAETMEKLSPQVVVEEVMKLLRRFAGPEVPDPLPMKSSHWYSKPLARGSRYTGPDGVRDPLAMKRSTWFSNPFTRGSYSHRTVTSDAMNVWQDDLAQPVSNAAGKTILQFAGEATNQLHHSTVHGAVESGFREADRILSGK